MCESVGIQGIPQSANLLQKNKDSTDLYDYLWYVKVLSLCSNYLTCSHTLLKFEMLEQGSGGFQDTSEIKESEERS